MDNNKIQFIKDLDPEGIDGTIQSVLMRNDLHQIPYVNALEFLVKALNNDKNTLIKDNIRLSSKVKEL